MVQPFIISLLHLLIVVPLLLFVGFQRAATPTWLYIALIFIGSIVMFYHGFRLATRLKNNSAYSWVNALHVCIVAPLLLYIGYNKQNTPRFAYELLLMLGFAATGYHLFSIVRMLDAHPEPNL